MLHKRAQRSAAIGIDIERAKELRPPTCHGRRMSEAHELGMMRFVIPKHNRVHLVAESIERVFARTYRAVDLLESTLSQVKASNNE